MANEENLAPPFPKGVSGNPAGKPKGTLNRSTIVKQALLAIQAGEHQTVFDKMTAKLIENVIAKGDVQAYNALADSAFGKITDKVENRHVFTQMGSVELGDKTDALEFKVGKPAEKPQGEDE